MMKIRKVIFNETEEGIFTRKVSIDIGNRIIETPSRTLTLTDIKSKRQLPTSIPLEADLLILHTPLDLEKLFSSSEKEANSYFQKLTERLESYYGVMQGIQYIIPFIFTKKNEKVQLNEKHLKDLLKIIEFLILNEADYTFDTIILEAPTLRLSLHKEFLKHIIRSLDSVGVQVIPVIDIGDRNFYELIDLLDKEFSLEFIGVKYRMIRKYFRQYIKLMNIATTKERDSVLIILNVERYIEKLRGTDVRDFALPHYMPFIGFDIIVPKSTSIYQPGHPGPLIKPKLRLFKREELTLPLLAEMSFEDKLNAVRELAVDYYRDEELNEIARKILSNKINEIIEELVKKQKEDKYAREMLVRLYAFTRTQEVKASMNEFEYFRSISDLGEYLQERENIVKIHYSIYGTRKLI